MNVNIGSSTVEKIIDVTNGYLQKFIGPSIDEIGLCWSDNLKVWRLKNMLRNQEKVDKLIKEKGISTKQINLKVLFPYLENVSLEDDETLQDMWAKLFVNYVDTTRNLTVIVYPEILKQLSSDDVKLLELLTRYKEITWCNNTNSYFINNVEAKKTYQVSNYIESKNNLHRLGLIKSKHELGYGANIPFGDDDFYTFLSQTFLISDFGENFITACS